MEDETTNEPAHKPSGPGAFVVEIPSDAGPLYAICQTVMVVDGRKGLFGISPEEMARSFQFPYRAGPWPALPQGGHGIIAASSQSGRNIINIDQHNS